ncbi:MAG: hypothetical protein Q7J38_09235 [Gallionella sp.]|nr:hypothetical protein [Gallionella sp.]
MSYFIRGTIKLTVTNGEKKISVVPLSGFISPDKPRRAIAFPVPGEPLDAKLIEMTGDEKSTVDMDIESIKEHLSVLVQIAATQKPVELRVAVGEDKKLKVVGFVFPV